MAPSVAEVLPTGQEVGLFHLQYLLPWVASNFGVWLMLSVVQVQDGMKYFTGTDGLGRIRAIRKTPLKFLGSFESFSSYREVIERRGCMWEGEVILFTKQAGNSPMPKEKSIIWKLPGSYFFQIWSFCCCCNWVFYRTLHKTQDKVYKIQST